MASFTAGLSCLAHPALAATKVTVAVISLADDARYGARREERAYPGHPTGRAVDGAQLGADDSSFELDAEGIALEVRDVVLPSAVALPKALAELKAAKVQHLVADLPLAVMRQLVQTAPAALGGAMVFNAGLDDDSLRADGCAAVLLHTYPSRQMMSDALVQYLAARNWRKALVLQGPLPGDALQGQAWARSAKRYGIKTTQERPFKLSGDPRERNLANTRLLTGDRDHDVVAVMDSDGEFARGLPYATQWPRPVVGANGLMAVAWHPQWERNGGPQLSRRFAKATHRPMTGQDWAAWMAVRSVVAALVDNPKSSVAEQLKGLRSGKVFVDGFKGPRLSFRAWDGQLRQPLFLSHIDGVVGTAPLDGVLHPKEVLDTLGVDEKESTCKARL
ncbi:branched-chain amino acid ABC transporter substrate-binding protein [Hydrogenophaga crassostreae]|uniref:Branched-chain amino acid ABC transporter substrate-binding protein n=1 Tax=Hydrogenophaga crassostreae TaxID=1763535 RepID=A0A167J2W4_9BURK|nr:branched-chain amino acid ABC transporter substrate-binding protein [Hydrogenophaga crassostreae]OAD44368.1 branched-chain amino acid ABC transporter substrate-binding protein [Hydrogenophaga crassostreae]